MLLKIFGIGNRSLRFVIKIDLRLLLVDIAEFKMNFFNCFVIQYKNDWKMFWVPYDA